MAPLSYTVRRNALESARTWTLDQTGLGWSDDKTQGHFKFGEISTIRLEWGATRFDGRRFLCSVSRFNGWMEQIVSTEYSGLADFTDRKDDYLPFVRALVAATAAANPSCRFVAGSSLGKYWVNLASLAFAVAVIAIAAVSIGIPLTAVVVAKGIVIAFLLPLAISWVRRNRPRPFDPQAIPADVIP
jgi:hypothetical protein